MRRLVTTDLDATLLDESYSWQAARPALARLFERRVPLVLNSSKTLAEMVPLRCDLIAAFASLEPRIGVVAENGAVFLAPQQSDPSEATLSSASRREILRVVHGLRAEGRCDFEGFADWTATQIREHTGLALDDATRSSQRLATEPILWRDSQERLATFTKELARHGLHVLRGGRFLHLMGQADKVDGLRRLMQQHLEARDPSQPTMIVALGDSPNDLAMLEAADVAVVVPHEDGPRVFPRGRHVRRAPRPGPAGWNDAVLELIDQLPA